MERKRESNHIEDYRGKIESLSQRFETLRGHL